jgi:hypothetical protein
MDDRTRDELAGVVDLFGGLTRDELADALLELAFKRGQDVDKSAVDATISAAVHDYYLVEVPARYVVTEHDGDADAAASGAAGGDTDADDTILAPGPVAFPTLPAGAEDLPHILDAPRRSLDREVLGVAIVDQLRAEVDDADADRARYLLDVTYDAEALASVDLTTVRDDLESRLDGGS